MTTKYSILKDKLNQRIRSAQYAPGSLIPSEAELAAEFNISRNTVRQALKELENAGILIRQRGKGTFVRDNEANSAQKIALFIYDTADIRHSVTTEMISGFSSYLESQGYMLDILLSPRTYHEEDLQQLAKKYSGFAFGTYRLDPLTVNTLDKLTIPHIFIKNYLPQRNDQSVRVDFFKTGFMAVEHLKECGCKTLGLVYPGKNIPIATEFFNGVCAAVMEYGLFMKLEHIFETGNYVSDAVKTAAEKIAVMNNRPDGIVAAADSAARILLEVFERQDVAVPNDVMVIGCNDTSDIPKMTNPPLSTIALPMKKAGQTAAAMLIDLLHGKKVDSLMLEPTLTVRQSTRKK